MLIPMDRLELARNDDPDGKITGIIHAGAHQGEEAQAYIAAGVPDVLWIEANPDLIAGLRREVSRHGHDVACALLDATGGSSRTFHVSNNGMSSSMFEFGTHSQVSPEVEFVRHVTLRTRTLDSVVSQHEAKGYNFLNMDLQGGELECLKGAENTIDGLDYVFTEVNVDELYKDCAKLEELDNFLVARGFECRRIVLSGAQWRDRRDGEPWMGWGDGFWVRTPSPRNFREVYPNQARDWL